MTENWLAEEVKKDSKAHRRANIKAKLIVAAAGMLFLTGGVSVGAKLAQKNNNLPQPSDEPVALSSTPTPSASATPTPLEAPNSGTVPATASIPSYQPAVGSSFPPPSYQPVTAPSSAPNAWASGSGILSGTYYYAVTFTTDTGIETDLGPASLSASPHSQEVWLTNIPTSSNSSVSERKIYRTTANGSMVGPFYLLTTISNNTSTTLPLIYDNTPDSGLDLTPKYR